MSLGRPAPSWFPGSWPIVGRMPLSEGGYTCCPPLTVGLAQGHISGHREREELRASVDRRVPSSLLTRAAAPSPGLLEIPEIPLRDRGCCACLQGSRQSPPGSPAQSLVRTHTRRVQEAGAPGRRWSDKAWAPADYRSVPQCPAPQSSSTAFDRCMLSWACHHSVTQNTPSTPKQSSACRTQGHAPASPATLEAVTEGAQI